MENFADLVSSFSESVEAGPQWVALWVNFMGLVNMAAIPFAFYRPEARWAIVAMLLVFPSMMCLYAQVGYDRILGIVHVVFWTPLLVWLWGRREQWRVRETVSGKWIALFAATIFVSLVLDYADVVRWLLGDRS